MDKITNLFQTHKDGLASDQITPGAEWVADGEGIATRKWDGVLCLVVGTDLFKRPAPPAVGEGPDWVQVGDTPEDVVYWEAWHAGQVDRSMYADPDGTYELVGPGIGENADGFDRPTLLKHSEYHVSDVPRTFGGLRAWFSRRNINGIVWHHPDGRMVKVEKKHFGLTG